MVADSNTSLIDIGIPSSFVKKELHCELVPKTCWYSNVRDHTTQTQWDKIRNVCYKLANYRCEICGDTGIHQGRKHRCEAHEIWKYDDVNRLQTLIGLISLCPRCHEVKHYGRATILGNDKRARFHLKYINSHWTWGQVFKHCENAIAQYEERSKYDYELNMDWLNKTFNLNIKIHREKKIDDTLQ